MKELIEYKEMREAIVRVRNIIDDLKLLQDDNVLLVDIDHIIEAFKDALDGGSIGDDKDWVL
jgi:hypothetical protein